ncbi:type VI secretion system tip protein VgrG [Limnobaculum zhutongyuii]|uniref:Type VI secretion system tip protein VgrG n=1 Tax=Limnobaculum zhutongyuii TaxID=2498113 RepID=A0A411WLB5_9GAMM|nr:type VI secretion system tip protein TssI/VgrG [Limnobaculum zhutongyuii]QBH97029.1 type VI secretion system tip protein VgrG [Limnobaculum zhutongyuii]TQS87421.1 type VI secretion system tip protein VgrG [Limnobaculum zhutongyuii]
MDTGLYFSCKIGSLPETTFDVVDFTLEEALSTLFTLDVKVASDDANINMDEQLLQKATLTIKVDGEVKRIINGIVEEGFRGDSGFQRTYYTFTIRPELWLLTLTQDNRIFHFKSVPDILDELLQKHSVRAESKLIDSHKQWEYTTQRNETDYQFFSRLAAEEGIVFWFEENSMFYSDSRTGMTGGEKLLYNLHIQGFNREAVIHRLQYGAKMKPNAVHLKDYKFSHPDVGLDSKVNQAKKRPLYTMYESYGRYDDDGVAQQYAKYRLEAHQANSLSGKAESNSIQLMPGKIFTIEEHPADAMNSNWQIVKIVHRGTLPQSVEKESVDKVAAITNEFTFIPGSVDWRAPFIAKPTVYGDETATVVGPAGEEIYVNEYGEVKIHFHWNKYDAADENASCWVRAGQGWNGDGFGFMAVPRIGQEVIIAYLNGDIDMPVIVGTLYNGKNSTPVSLPAKKTRMTIRSQTHKGQGFNEIGLEDESGQEEFYMHAQKDMNTDVLNNKGTHVINDHNENVDNNQTMVVGVDQTLNVGNNQAGTIGVDQTLDVGNNQTNTIGTNQSSTIGVDQSWDVGSNQTSTIGVDQTTTVGSNQTDTVGANRTATIGGNDVLTVQANQAETIAIAKAETIGAAKALSIGAAYQITVGGAMNTSVGLAQGTQVGLGKSLLVGKDYSQNIGKDKSTTVAKDTKFKSGKDYVINAGNSVTIVCGQSKLVMKKDGTITLNGKDLMVKTTAKQTFKASGDIKLKGKKIHEN